MVAQPPGARCRARDGTGVNTPWTAAAARAHTRGMKAPSMSWVRRLVPSLLVTLLLALSGWGCRTAHGFGEDMEKAGEKIQDGTK